MFQLHDRTTQRQPSFLWVPSLLWTLAGKESDTCPRASHMRLGFVKCHLETGLPAKLPGPVKGIASLQSGCTVQVFGVLQLMVAVDTWHASKVPAWA